MEIKEMGGLRAEMKTTRMGCSCGCYCENAGAAGVANAGASSGTENDS